MFPNSFLAITAGDPCGIGPEVILKALTRGPSTRGLRVVVIGDCTVFEAAARRLRCRLPPWSVMTTGRHLERSSGPLVFLDCSHRQRYVPERSSAAAGRASLDYLDHALALQKAGHLAALVTAPVTKWAIGQVAPSFIGQTEYLSRAMKRRDVVMMFVSEVLRVALLTRHVPLSRVGRSIDRRLVRTTLRLVAASLKTQFRIAKPTLAICGVNPHAGEASRCGEEEERVIVPVLRELRRRGLRCDGPFAADGLFASLQVLRGRSSYDAIVCAYHDQGLIPFKMVARDRGCQLSIGLPIIRTSPDHGSALDIAGKNIADPGSMIYAITLAANLVGRREKEVDVKNARA